MNSENSWKIQAICIAVAGLLAHGLLLLTDYQVRDGFITGGLLKNPAHWEHLVRWSTDSGKPLEPWMYFPLRGLNDVYFWGKVMSLASWIAIFIVISCLLPHLLGVPIWFAFGTSLIGVTLPFYEMLGVVNFVPYTVSLLAYWLAWHIHAKSLSKTKILKCIGLRFLSILLLWWGLQLNSLLFFQYGLLLVVFFCSLRKEKNIAVIAKETSKRIDFLLLPLFFWIHKSLFTPTSGYYKDSEYNVINKNILRYFEGFNSTVLEISKRFVSIFENPRNIQISDGENN
jgi:hypothetical protein